ncbi:aldo/keto reductase [Deinococcus cellulosilyticus]|uniref:Aldo/keto reductase n=1 Tax=Deinococcus cellulosilyticus (strain DSM 18568 / NBRC 106333 / KACC 11606 / 5516J-15) TaxID=1223518 RepID=A0A511N057_DEIC1|nr:aldo/keto reductase [Deinococcus cellulosilyticus]GEM46260.1 aldo/keto reductase [Deinococcus cellulosilyticus NBRC 106333 = KACC 11606]
MFTRQLGRSGIQVSALGLGGWAIGGPFKGGQEEWGYGPTDDQESLKAIQAGMDHGVTLLDTAANYGAGHSEKLIGQAIKGRRDRVVISTKFGYRVLEDQKLVDGLEVYPEAIRASCEASLRRLGTDYIDLFFFHVGDHPADQVDDVLEVLETLVHEGKIRSYGWSTDDLTRAQAFAGGKHCTAIQHQLNLFEDNPEMLALCETENLSSLNRGPLAMGLLTGKYNSGAHFPATDLRSRNHPWMHYFKDGQPNPEWLKRLADVRDILTSGGRTLSQGALAWLWARSPATLPIPGFRTVAQAIENARALEFGPLTAQQMKEIQHILEGASEPWPSEFASVRSFLS